MLTAAVAALAVVGSAAAVIVPQRSIAGVELTMTRPQVKAVLGEPSSVERGMNDFGPYRIFHYLRLAVTFQGEASATAITTRRFSEQTSRGIGRGSTEAALKAAYPRANCRTEAPGFRHCWLGRFQAGRRVTDFRIRQGEVSRVTVAFVID